MKSLLRLALLATLCLGFVGCNDDDDDDDDVVPTPTPGATATPTPDPDASPTPTPTASPTPTPDGSGSTSAPLADGTTELVEIDSATTSNGSTTITVTRDNGEQWAITVSGTVNVTAGEGLIVSADSGVFGDTDGSVTFENGTTVAIFSATQLL